MYDIKQFRPCLYVLAMLGISGFCIAALEPVLWFLAIGCILLNAYLVYRGRFRPIAQWLSNLITVLSLVFVSYQIMLGATAVLLVGEFLVFLQIVKFFEQRVNRDYGQVLILSLLLMVAAMISTYSLLFGMLLLVYLLLGLYTCVLFHLKVEADRARAAQTLPPDKISAAALRQDQDRFSSSMRRMTGLLASVAVTVAVIVFIGCPRGSSSGVFGQMAMRTPDELSGFSDRVTYDQINKIKQDNSIVAYVKVWKGSQPIEGTTSIYLRGMTLDRYTRDGPGNAWQWVHSEPRPSARVVHVDQIHALPLRPTDVKADALWRQEIHLFPTGTLALFALPGAKLFTPHQRDVRLRFEASDGTLQNAEMSMIPLDYEVISTNNSQDLLIHPRPQPPVSAFGLSRSLGSDAEDPAPNDGSNAASQASKESKRQSYDQYKAAINPEIAKYAQSIIGDLKNKLPKHRLLSDAPSPLDEKVAQAIAEHLQTKFKYTLDFTTLQPRAEEDPLVSFLTKWKRGHCEYFAGAMTLMCQSLGMQARMVIGFRTDEYNSLLHQYTVRGSHAHAWVEVLTQHGWTTFDPTSNINADADSQSGVVEAVRHFFNYLEYQWASAVIGYDNESRNNLMLEMQRRLTNTVYRGSDGLYKVRQWWDELMDKLNDVSILSFWPKALTALVGVLIAMLIWVIASYAANRWKIYRRAKAIGLDALPTAERLRIARQLGFYEEMTRLLLRQKIIRKPQQTPREFSESLSYLPADVYGSIRRLTSIFYRIRYGGALLDPAKQRRLDAVVAKLGQRMG